jgi:hypothetical protein
MDPTLVGPYQGSDVIGEVTESLHKFLLDGWQDDELPLHVETDLKKEPPGSGRVIYVYMYRLARNTALLNSKRRRLARVAVGDDPLTARNFYERPPLYLDLYYLLGVHAQHRRDAEKLLGWVLLRLNEATHLVYRPRRYVLPTGEKVDAKGRPWRPDATGEGIIMEKVSVDIVDDLTIGDALNFFSTHDAPYRPYVTYRARCAMEGSLVEAGPTTIRSAGVDTVANPEDDLPRRPSGPRSASRPPPPQRRRTPFGPEGFGHRPIAENDEE